MTGDRDDGSSQSGILVLAATPLGDPRDASVRLRELIAQADLIAAEDTRRFRRLCRDLDVKPTGPVVSCYDAVEHRRAGEIAAAVEAGQTVLFVSDAGMPAISDPGYRLAQLCHQRGLRVGVAPGPSAVTMALALSGLPSDRFVFEGFLPRRGRARIELLEQLAIEPRTIVMFEAATRTPATLKELAEVFGASRPACLCREMTKTYEEVRRSTLAELSDHFSDGLKGEVTIVIAGLVNEAPTSIDEVVSQVLAGVAAGANQKDLINELARQNRVSKRELYNAVLAAKASP